MKLKKLFIVVSIPALFAVMLGISKSQLSDIESQTFSVSVSSNLSVELRLLADDENWLLSEMVANGDFSSNLDHWNQVGETELIESGEQQWLQLGNSASSNLWSENCISQAINIDQGCCPFLKFDYQLFTEEELSGFDQHAFVVLINDQLVFSQGHELNQEYNSGRWKTGWVSLSKFAGNQPLQIKICSGNTLDRQDSSWVWLDNISTLGAACSADDKVGIIWPSQIGSITVTNSNFDSPQTLTFSESPAEIEGSYLSQGVLLYQVEDEFSHVILSGQLQTAFEDQPPPPSDYQLYQESDGSYTFMFGSDSSQTSDYFKYLLGYSADSFASGTDPQINWIELPLLTAASLNDLSWQLAGQQLRHLNQQIFMEVPNFFSLKAVNLVGNSSELGPVAELSFWQSSQAGTSGVLLNEIMFNPHGNDYSYNFDGEWIELYNSSSSLIDLNQWLLVDEADNQIIISSQNSDSDLDLNDQGETVIEPGGFLTVYRSGSPILNNSGDTIYLLSTDSEIADQHTYSSGTEGKTAGRLPDGGVWSEDLTASPGEANSVDD